MPEEKARSYVKDNIRSKLEAKPVDDKLDLEYVGIDEVPESYFPVFGRKNGQKDLFVFLNEKIMYRFDNAVEQCFLGSVNMDEKELSHYILCDSNGFAINLDEIGIVSGKHPYPFRGRLKAFDRLTFELIVVSPNKAIFRDYDYTEPVSRAVMPLQAKDFLKNRLISIKNSAGQIIPFIEKQAEKPVNVFEERLVSFPCFAKDLRWKEGCDSIACLVDKNTIFFLDTNLEDNIEFVLAEESIFDLTQESIETQISCKQNFVLCNSSERTIQTGEDMISKFPCLARKPGGNPLTLLLSPTFGLIVEDITSQFGISSYGEVLRGINSDDYVHFPRKCIE